MIYAEFPSLLSRGSYFDKMRVCEMTNGDGKRVDLNTLMAEAVLQKRL